jgi:aminoglycoside phosphotransferase (APT) family kinase protein
VSLGEGDRLLGHPAGHELISTDAVRAYVSSVLGEDRITEVTRFESGNRHFVHRVSRTSHDVVVRVSFSASAHEVEQFERETAVLSRVGGVVAPVLYDFRRASEWFDAPVMCMQLVPGSHRDLSSLDDESLARVGALMARVHAIPADDVFPESTTSAEYRDARLHFVLEQIAALREPLPPAYDARLRGVAGRLAPGTVREELVLLHGDPSSGNILWPPESEPVFIDWEYSRLGAPADEIAYLFSQEDLSDAQRAAFWRGYGHLSDGVVAHVDWWEPLTLAASALWWVERWQARTTSSGADPSVPRPASYYLSEAEQRLQRVEALFR